MTGPDPRGKSASPEQGGNDARLEQLKKLVEADPNDAFCLYGLGQEYARRSEVDEAVAWYDRCIAVDPDYCYAYYHKAVVLEHVNRTDEAVAALRIGLERARSSGDSHAASEIGALLDQVT